MFPYAQNSVFICIASVMHKLENRGLINFITNIMQFKYSNKTLNYFNRSRAFETFWEYTPQNITILYICCTLKILAKHDPYFDLLLCYKQGHP